MKTPNNSLLTFDILRSYEENTCDYLGRLLLVQSAHLLLVRFYGQASQFHREANLFNSLTVCINVEIEER